jgi:TPR repeat protein
MIQNGYGVVWRDREVAILWYRLAAAQGNAQAKTNLEILGA